MGDEPVAWTGEDALEHLRRNPMSNAIMWGANRGPKESKVPLYRGAPPPPQGEPMGALGEAIEWIQKAPEGTWGYGSQEDGYGNIQQWPLRDELVSRLQAAFLAPPQGEPVTEALPVAWVVQLRYGDHWSGEMLTDVLPANKDGYRVLRPLYASAQPTAGWRDISTAPKEHGKSLLLCRQEPAPVVSPVSEGFWWSTSSKDGYWGFCGASGFSEEGEPLTFHAPTHWQPLPPPPPANAGQVKP